MMLRKGNKGPDVQKLQKGLALLGFHPGSADGFFGQRTEDAVENFQASRRLYPDGIFGPASIKMWNDTPSMQGRADWFAVMFLNTETPAKVPELVEWPEETRLTWVRCSADPVGGGYDHLTLRSDVADDYNKVLIRAHRLGGVVTTAGGKRNLSSKTSASRSKRSFHYVGRAFDLATYSGMQDVEKDPLLVTRCPRDPRKFEVWAKASETGVVHLEAIETRQFKDAKGRRRSQMETVAWTGAAINLTEMLKSCGFRAIRARTSFVNGGSYAGAEWWHFQWEKKMIRGVSTFGEELLRVYTLAQCKQFAYWDEVENSVFGETWL